MSDNLPTLATNKGESLATLQAALSSELSKSKGADARVPDHSNTSRAARIGLWAIGLGFGGFLLWAGLAPLDEGVPASATVAVDTRRKPVQHPTGGIVREVFVREGSVVKAGQPLIRLDDAVAKATYENSRQRYYVLLALQGRLRAEQSGAGTVTFSDELLTAAKTDPEIARQIENQRQLFLTRRSALTADLQGMEENILGLEGMIKAYEGMMEGRRKQLALVTEELANTRDLVKDGYAPRNRLLELERMTTDSRLALTELTGTINRSQRGVAEIRQRMVSRRQEFRKEVETSLADTTAQVLAESARFVAAGNEVERTLIKSPADGQVLSLQAQSTGAVIAPGSRIMEIVPQDEPLVLDAQIPPFLIDRVHKDGEVDIRFSAFSHTPTLVVQGKIASLSKDVIMDQQLQHIHPAGYYLARVVVTPEGIKQLGKHQIQPGMMAEVIFLTGERTVLTYLMSPLTKRISASMKEQ